MKHQTTWDEAVNVPACERRPITSQRAGESSVGRSVVYLGCPFCGVEVRAFIWSLAGHGKRCQCGALLGHRGAAYRLVLP